MRFSDPRHTMSELVFQGAHEAAVAEVCDERLLSALGEWEQRSDITDPRANLFHFDNTRAFTISYDGVSGNYWPDEDSNTLGETLIREHFYVDGICRLPDLNARLYVVKYKIQALYDSEYLLVCPYPTRSNNLAGLVVICANHLLRASAAQKT